jgi:hypothetical protein
MITDRWALHVGATLGAVTLVSFVGGLLAAVG